MLLCLSRAHSWFFREGGRRVCGKTGMGHSGVEDKLLLGQQVSPISGGESGWRRAGRSF
jgi:hypothetical protein